MYIVHTVHVMYFLSSSLVASKQASKMELTRTDVPNPSTGRRTTTPTHRPARFMPGTCTHQHQVAIALVMRDETFFFSFFHLFICEKKKLISGRIESRRLVVVHKSRRRRYPHAHSLLMHHARAHAPPRTRRRHTPGEITPYVPNITTTLLAWSLSQ